MNNKPTFTGFIAGQFSLDGIYVYRNKKEHTIFKEKNSVLKCISNFRSVKLSSEMYDLLP